MNTTNITPLLLQTLVTGDTKDLRQLSPQKLLEFLSNKKQFDGFLDKYQHLDQKYSGIFWMSVVENIKNLNQLKYLNVVVNGMIENIFAATYQTGDLKIFRQFAFNCHKDIQVKLRPFAALSLDTYLKKQTYPLNSTVCGNLKRVLTDKGFQNHSIGSDVLSVILTNNLSCFWDFLNTLKNQNAQLSFHVNRNHISYLIECGEFKEFFLRAEQEKNIEMGYAFNAFNTFSKEHERNVIQGRKVLGDDQVLEYYRLGQMKNVINVWFEAGGLFLPDGKDRLETLKTIILSRSKKDRATFFELASSKRFFTDENQVKETQKLCREIENLLLHEEIEKSLTHAPISQSKKKM